MKKIIKMTIYVTLAVFIIMYLLSLCDFGLNPLKYVSLGASIADSLILLYCKFLWKVKCFNFFKIPNVNGTWTCTIEYKKDNVLTKKDSIIIITQDIFETQVNLVTNEIKSHSLCANIVCEHNIYYLIYTYRTNPEMLFRDNNPVQWGTAKLDISNRNNIHGEYWTTRRTQGTMKLKKDISK